MTGGAPVLTAAQFATLRNIKRVTLMNQIYARTCPVPMFRDGSEWFAHVSDVAAWLDAEREKAHGEREEA